MYKRFLFYTASLLFFFVFAACQQRVSTNEQIQEIKSLEFSITPYQLEEESPDTRTAVNGTSFQWAAGDTVGIYPNTGAQVYFAMTSGAGASTAVFDGGGWAFKPSSFYYSYYPFIGSIYLNRNHIPVSYLGQKQIGKTATDHIGPYDFMYTRPSSAQDGNVNFQYDHLNCIIRPRLQGLPAGHYTKLAVTAPSAVFPTKGYYDLMAAQPAIIPTQWSNQLVIDLEEFYIQEGAEALVYLMCAPVQVGGVELTISVLNEQRTEYQCKKTPSDNYVAGRIKGLTCNTFDAVPQSMGLIINDWGDGGEIGGNAN